MQQTGLIKSHQVKINTIPLHSDISDKTALIM